MRGPEKSISKPVSVCGCRPRRNDHWFDFGPVTADDLNILSPGEQSAGWNLLFDGATLRRWRRIQDHGDLVSFPASRFLN